MASGQPADPGRTLFVAKVANDELLAVPLHVWHGVMARACLCPGRRHAPTSSAPVLILSGGKDPLFPAEHHAPWSGVSGAEAHVFPRWAPTLVEQRAELGRTWRAFGRSTSTERLAPVDQPHERGVPYDHRAWPFRGRFWIASSSDSVDARCRGLVARMPTARISRRAWPDRAGVAVLCILDQNTSGR